MFVAACSAVVFLSSPPSATAQQAMTPVAVPGIAGWSKTKEGCHVWNSSPVAGEAVSWTGTCEAGVANGSGILTWGIPSRPSRYEGNYLRGRRNGTGTIHFSNGNSYAGEWSNDRYDGAGKFTFRNGSTVTGVYTGNFSGGKIEGPGSMEYSAESMVFPVDAKNGCARAGAAWVRIGAKPQDCY
jgi:hypothetical protein